MTDVNAASRGLDRALSAPLFANSDPLRYVRENALAGVILSNQPDGVYIHTSDLATHRNLCVGIETLRHRRLRRRRPRELPRLAACSVSGAYSGERRTGVKPQLENVPDGTYIVWLHDAFNKGAYGYDVAELRALLPGLRMFAEFSDGVILQVDKAAAPRMNDYQTAYRSTRSSFPRVMESDFDVYLRNDTLIWVKEPCSRADVDAMFHLYITPMDTTELSEEHRREYGFEIRDFYFDRQRGGVFRRQVFRGVRSSSLSDKAGFHGPMVVDCGARLGGPLPIAVYRETHADSTQKLPLPT